MESLLPLDIPEKEQGVGGNYLKTHTTGTVLFSGQTQPSWQPPRKEDGEMKTMNSLLLLSDLLIRHN